MKSTGNRVSRRLRYLSRNEHVDRRQLHFTFHPSTSSTFPFPRWFFFNLPLILFSCTNTSPRSSPLSLSSGRTLSSLQFSPDLHHRNNTSDQLFTRPPRQSCHSKYDRAKVARSGRRLPCSAVIFLLYPFPSYHLGLPSHQQQ
jgi:hypothetical protein